MALNEVFQLEEVRVIDKFDEIEKSFVEDMGGKYDFPIVPVSSNEKAVEGADIVVTATTGDEVMVKNSQFVEGMFLAKVGSYQEIDLEIVRSTADKVVIDFWDYVSHRVKEIASQLKTGAITRDRIYAEIADIVVGKKPGRENDNEKIVFISIGMGVEDAAAAMVAYENAMRQNIGTVLEI